MNGSKESKLYSQVSKFSHIYIERDARTYSLTRSILAKFPNAKLIEIERFQEVFNRKAQNWRESKDAQKLILAVKRDGFLQDKSEMIQETGVERFFYTAPVLNCIYDCDYCFLQGMFSSPHLVTFVNENDFFMAVDRELSNGAMYLSPSYETDLLAIQGIVPWASKWIEFAQSREAITIEIRTKSSSYKALSRMAAPPNVILSWTVSPEVIAGTYERGTPSTRARLLAASEALSDGWQVRLCVDPILMVKDWDSIYSEFFSELNNNFPVDRLKDIWLGTLRMSNEHLKNIQRQREDSDILYFPFERFGQYIGYPSKLARQALELARTNLTAISQDKVISE